jgi:hypothetical protein
MTDATDKLSFENISFDDMINEGIETTPEVSEAKVAEPEEKPAALETNETEAKQAENELDSDAVEEQKTPSIEDIPPPVEEPKKTLAEEPVAEETPAEETATVVAGVLDRLGYKVDREYEDTEEGLVELTKDVGSQLAQEHMKQLMDEFPMVRQHLEYVMAGGESQNFMNKFDPRADYSKIALNKDDLSMQKMLVGNYFKMKGHDDAFIKDILEDYQDGGKLLGKAELAQKALVNAQRHERNEMLKRQQMQAQQARQEQRQFWDGVYDTINKSTEFSGISVPERDKKKFFKYVSAPINQQGNTQRDLDHGNATLETKLAIDYLMFKGFKLDDIIKAKVGTAKAKDLKSRITKHQEKVKSAKGPARRNTGFDIEDLDLTVI